MNEYISREAVEQVLCGIANGLSVGEAEALKAKDVKALYKIKGAKEILNAVDNDLSFIPAADVQPVKRGRWSECYTDSHHYSGICSVCGRASIRSIRENPLEYCPKCGARMDGNIKSAKDGDTE